MDPVEELSSLRQKFPKVIIQSRAKKIDPGDGYVAQYWFKENNIRCRMIRPSKTKYVNVSEFEPYLRKATSLPAKPTPGPRDLTPMQYGKGLIAMLGGEHRWCGSKYMAVSLPENGEFMLASWRGWLRFMEWTGHNPQKRTWSDTQRWSLLSSGQYAWLVVMDRGANQAKILYSGGTRVGYESSWFHLSKPEEMQKMLIEASKLADSGHWRDAEITDIDMSRVEETQIEKRRERQQKYREQQKTKPVIEITRVPDPDDEFKDPLTPEGWNGDLGTRYADE